MKLALRLLLTCGLLAWVATGSRTALVITLALQAVESEMVAYALRCIRGER